MEKFLTRTASSIVFSGQPPSASNARLALSLSSNVQASATSLNIVARVLLHHECVGVARDFLERVGHVILRELAE